MKVESSLIEDFWSILRGSAWTPKQAKEPVFTDRNGTPCYEGDTVLQIECGFPIPQPLLVNAIVSPTWDSGDYLLWARGSNR